MILCLSGLLRIRLIPLNLSEYFVDPDSDFLTFTISDMDNVSVDIRGSVAVFTPDPDWAGSRRFRITAFDGRGGVTRSPRMTLEVVEMPEYTPWLLYERYCLSVNLFLLFIIVILLSFLAGKTSLVGVLLPELPVVKKTPRKKVVKKRSSRKRGRPPKNRSRK